MMRVLNFLARCIISGVASFIVAQPVAFILAMGDAASWGSTSGAPDPFLDSISGGHGLELMLTPIVFLVTTVIFLIPVKPLFQKTTAPLNKFAAILLGSILIIVCVVLMYWSDAVGARNQQLSYQNERDTQRAVSEYAITHRTELNERFPGQCFDIYMPGFVVAPMGEWATYRATHPNAHAYNFCSGKF